MKFPLACCGFLFLLLASCRAVDFTVDSPAALRSALGSLLPGSVLKIGPGQYPGGNHVSGVDRLTVEARDPKNPPVFSGGGVGWHFSNCPNLTVRNIKVTGQTGNGLNLDDGGQKDRAVTGITLERIEVSDIGPKGNCDGIKCSGLDKVTIRDCTITGWGGEGIDFVGCHQSLVTGCRFVGKEGFTAAAAVQMKGGSSDIVVEKCQFVNAGQRPINLGGSTGAAYFRPLGVKYEAARLIVRDNVIEGSLCAAAFVGIDGGEFSNNTIRYPTKWVFRILQETRDPEFAPCRNVVIKNNKITLRRAQVQTEVNVGPGTSAETFRFEGNSWFAEDRPGASKPQLPSEEKGGVYGKQ